MDDQGTQAPEGASPADSTAGWDTVVPTAFGVATIACGRIERRQHRRGSDLLQSVELRRHDGSTWMPYLRHVALPHDTAAADRATQQASSVLRLLAQALAAAETARQARGIMAEWSTTPAAWVVHYDAS